VSPDRPYFFTLGPYAAHWFSLVTQPMQVTQTMSQPEQVPPVSTAEELPGLLVGVNWETVLDSSVRLILERQALVPYIKRQRWFAAKSRTIRDARFSDWVMLRGGATPAFMALVTVNYTEGEPETYVVPLALLAGEPATRAIADTPGAVVARITGARKGAIVDGLLDDDVCGRLIEASDAETRLRSMRGTLRGVRAAGVVLPDERKWARAAADSSNTVVFVSDRYVLKLFRRLDPGPNPEFEIGQALTAAGFTRIPALASALLYERTGTEAATMAVVQAAVANQGSGWTFTIDELRRYYERVTARVNRPDADSIPEGADVAVTTDGPEPPPFFAALEGWYLGAAATLGRRTAELHLALADADGERFAPERLDRARLRTMSSNAVAHANGVLTLLAARADSLSDESRARAAAVLQAGGSLLDGLRAIEHLRDAGQRIRVHGDYHLGQVLRTEEDFVILDFEGEPARTLAERRDKYSPLKDVAGMLRSFHYAAYAALFAFAQTSPGAADRLAPWADAWQHWVSRAFVAAYRQTMADSRLLPQGESFDALLQALTLEKALYELGYELNSRPDWAAIPLTALMTLALPLQR
jgi:maltose alpha-D-glucosyltransferase/alpha-amylase